MGGLGGGLKPPYFQAHNIEKNETSLFKLSKTHLLSSLPHVIARSHKISSIIVTQKGSM